MAHRRQLGRKSDGRRGAHKSGTPCSARCNYIFSMRDCTQKMQGKCSFCKRKSQTPSQAGVTACRAEVTWAEILYRQWQQTRYSQLMVACKLKYAPRPCACGSHLQLLPQGQIEGPMALADGRRHWALQPDAVFLHASSKPREWCRMPCTFKQSTTSMRQGTTCFWSKQLLTGFQET